MRSPQIHPDAIELGGLLRDAWPTMLKELRASGVPLMADDPPKDPPNDLPADPPKDPPADPPADPPKDEPLGESGKAALEAERTARKAAEKTAREAQKKLDAAEAEKLSETEKLKKEAEDGKALAATATDKLRLANLRDALADKGFAGAKAKAVVRLLDGVEYDDGDEPTNLDAVLKTAEKEYGELVKPGKPAAPDIDPGGGGGGKAPALTADELAAAKAAGMTPEEYANYKSPQPTLPERKTT
jgi:hypothetical protein